MSRSGVNYTRQTGQQVCRHHLPPPAVFWEPERTHLGVLPGGELNEREAPVGAGADPSHLLRQPHRVQLTKRPENGTQRQKTSHKRHTASHNVPQTAHSVTNRPANGKKDHKTSEHPTYGTQRHRTSRERNTASPNVLQWHTMSQNVP